MSFIEVALHGRYLGYIRQLKPMQRAEVKSLREKNGVEVTIKSAKGIGFEVGPRLSRTRPLLRGRTHCVELGDRFSPWLIV